MGKSVASIIVLALALCLVVSATPAAGPKLATASSKDLPVLKLPAAFWAGEPSSLNSELSFPSGSAIDPKWAVVIGISDYVGTGNDLWNPANDALEMKGALVDIYNFPEENIIMLLDSQATAANIVAAINWMADQEVAGDTVVFFFSGHGFRRSDAEGWDSDAESDGWDEGIVSHDMFGLIDGDLKSLFSAIESQKFALIFGSCHSGGMFDSEFEGRGKKNRVSVDLQAPGRVICSACKANEYAWDALQLENTLFGYYFVDEGILQGLADKRGNGVSIEEALTYARRNVRLFTRLYGIDRQSPQIYDGFKRELIP